MQKRLEELPKLAEQAKKESKKYFTNLKKRTPKNLDYIMQELHDKEFEKTDCLTCGNCCKTSSPIFIDKDIERISKHLKMKVVDFVNQYLQRDADDFMVLKSAPCTFFDETDNTCFIYDVRPKACQEYPHTNRVKFIQITDLTIANTAICPATYNIVEALKKRLPYEYNEKKTRK
ncbi:YkgJ family cysteine cluster protein [uncultured Polaribacter sp.]|uniref:YkgJ family cysteine cluster protein n=1 Tax=uncultured Polaribacter sp. TaxID=174711 RepID=UPI0027785FEE|nr:YkgJ family cysteine cluster protein [Polaribacter sp.]|tara:strand:+ start:1558 stop:2082 length:525 start_codon:yes stop_codon:yes gene_type:complete